MPAPAAAFADFVPEDFEFIVDGRADYPLVLFSGIVDRFVEVPFGSPSGPLSLGPVNTVALIDDSVVGSITSGGTGFVAMLITPNAIVQPATPDSRIGLFGPNTHLILNAGIVDMDVVMGQGQDIVYNFGLMFGEMRMGAGDDFFINDTLTTPDMSLAGVAVGRVFMGSGDDVVLNGSAMGELFMGDGNDFYAAITPQSLLDNYNNPAVSIDAIYAGNGNDTVFGGANDDLIYGQNGNDLLRGHGGDDTIFGGDNQDRLFGGQGEDRLVGGAGTDQLFGQNGDDRLLGGTGRDFLVGGRGDDIMVGGSGADRFTFFGRDGEDTIADFRDGDEIRIIAPFAEGIDSEGIFEALSAFISYNGNIAFIDLDGFFQSLDMTDQTGGGGDNSITLWNIGNDSLTADDFVF